MTFPLTPTIPQGATCAITAMDIRIDGQLVDMTGWTIHAVLRRDHVGGAIVATWRNLPGAGEGLAEVAPADLAVDPMAVGQKWVYLRITPDMSSAWTFFRGVVHAEATEPSGNPPRKVRIIDEPVYLDPEAVT